MANSQDSFFIFAAQRDLPNGVTISNNVTLLNESAKGKSLDSIFVDARMVFGMSEDYRLVSSFVSLVQPFDEPTECRVALTVMPGGASFTARLRQAYRIVMISDEYTLLDAFLELMHAEQGDTFIGWSYAPAKL